MLLPIDMCDLEEDMAQAKIQFKLGIIEFSGEGEEAWVTTQFDKLIEQAPVLLRLAPPTVGQGAAAADANQEAEPINVGKDVPLGTFLKSKNIGSNQVKRFLATAIWLDAQGNKAPKTNDVSKALSDSRQTKLSNPADKLNANVTKGFCEKQGKEFYVTPSGFESMK
jgi:hypothetical protein